VPNKLVVSSYLYT